MKIFLNETTYLKCGLELANQGKFYDALKLFNHCTSYEGTLNGILMMFCANEIFFANEYFYKLYSKYGQTHNVFSDLSYGLGYLKKDFLKFTQIPNADKKHRQNKIDGDKNLLFCFNVEEDFFDGYENFFFELGEQPANPSWFVDLKSDDYQLMLLANESEEFSNDAEKMQYSKTKLMQQKTDFLPTKLYQLRHYLENENYKKAETLALSIYQHPDLDSIDLFNIAALFYGCDQEKSKISEILHRILPDCQLSQVSIDHCMLIATNYLKDNNLSQKFAQKILAEQNAHTELLKGCLIVFFNLSDMQKCKEILVTINSLFPNDIYSQACLEYLNCKKIPQEHNLQLSSQTVRHIDIPPYAILGVLSEWNEFCDQDPSPKPDFDRLMLWLKTLLYSLPTHLIFKKVHDKYDIFLNIILDMLDFLPMEENLPQFEQLVLDYCCQFGNDPLICSKLWLMVSEFSSNDFFLRNAYVKYFFDINLLKQFPSKSKIRRIFALLATFVELNKTNISKFCQTYEFLRQNYPLLLSKAKDMQIVFYLVAETLSLHHATKKKLNKDQNTKLYQTIKQQNQQK